MTIEEAIKMLEYIRHTGNGESEYKNDAQAIALDMAIKSLEAWGKVKKEIYKSISSCESNTMRSTWCDGELAGFLQSKDIIDENLSEVSECK